MVELIASRITAFEYKIYILQNTKMCVRSKTTIQYRTGSLIINNVIDSRTHINQCTFLRYQNGN